LSESRPSVQVSHLDKWFGGTHALADVSMAFDPGEVHAVAGENGAGKSTLVKILAGVMGASEYTGELKVDGVSRSLHGVRDAERFGIFLVPQELNIVPELRVGEFLFLNREPQRWGLVDSDKLWRDTARWLEVFNLPVSPVARMRDISTHQQQLVSIARAMTQGVKVLILDEPTASLTERETELLFLHVGDLRRHGVAVIYISHRLREFERVADAATVMRDGRVVDQFRLSAVADTPRRVIRAMVGRELTEMYPKTRAVVGDPVLELRNWSVANPTPGRQPLVHDVDLVVREGEVVGLFGLIGGGASDLARSLFGAPSGRVDGELRIRGQLKRVHSPREAIAARVAYLPAERKRDGLILQNSISSNMSLVGLGRMTEGGAINRRVELESVQHYVSSLRIKCSSIEQPVVQLSGGNQQKVAAAKWLITEPELFVLDEPTRGVDVSARIDFYNLVNDLTANRKAVILVSTDLPEVLEMSDRIFAMYDGALVREWRRGDATEEDVMFYAAGGREVHA
jgi:ABC-type sugar transport system ATPase subunit